MNIARDGVGDDSTALRGILDAAGIAGRGRRTVVALLTESPHTLASLIRQTSVDRRTVEAILDALGADLVALDGSLRIAPGRIAAYRELVNYARLRETAPADPLGHLMPRYASLISTLDSWIAELPGARRGLDHVSATADTAVRRALWLDSTFDLDGARLLCAGDHDLTSLAVAEVNPRVEITVVDVDDRVLEFIDARAYPTVRCLWSDLRFGLADGAREWGDLVFTDPPYTPEGVRLFLARGLEGLRDRTNSRLVLSYGFGANHPGLGLKVQQELAGLRLVYEAVLPGFNRYHGAQAVGSASDLYVLRPTARSGTSAGRSAVNIYTHGAQSVEAGASGSSPDAVTALHTAAAGPDGLAVAVLGHASLGDASTGDASVGDASVGDASRRDAGALAGVFTGMFSGKGRAVAADLAGDPGGWLVRVLLAVDAPRLALLVPNNHPDLVNETAQRALTGLFSTKWRLRLRRSTPSPHLAIVEADRVDTAQLDPGDRAVRAVLDRAHGKVANTWREALIRAHAGGLTKNEARALVRDNAPGAVDEQLISLPRHQIALLPERIARSVAP